MGRLAAGILIIGLAGFSASGVTVEFGDPSIEARIRAEINNPDGPIDDSELTGITELNLELFNIANLSGLEYLVNLETLRLPRNRIANLTPLAGLDNLRTLDLGQNLIVDLGPLAALSGLTTVNLAANQIQSIAAIDGWVSVQNLNLSLNMIANISALASLTQLNHLNLADNFIADARPLLDNPGLGPSDTVDLTTNPLNRDSLCNVLIPLEDRGVTVLADEACPGIIEGRVVDALTGQPLDCAIVIAEPPIGNAGIGPTGFDGRYSMNDLAPGMYTLRAYAPGYVPAFMLGVVETFMIDNIRFELTPVQNSMTAITGVVTDHLTGLALAGVQVQAFSGTRILTQTFTCATGAYDIRVENNVTQVTLRFAAVSYTEESVNLTLAGDESRDVTLMPRDDFPGAISGAILDGRVGMGSPLPGARIVVKAEGGAVAFAATTDQSGAYTVGNLAPGTYTVRASSAAMPDTSEQRAIEVTDGIALLNFTLGSPPPDDDTSPGGCSASGNARGLGATGDALLCALALAMLLMTPRRRPVNKP